MNVALPANQRLELEEQFQLQEWEKEIDDDKRLTQLAQDYQNEIKKHITQ